MDTKEFLKFLKLNESRISMVLGALVVLVLGVIVINFLRNNKGTVETGISTTQSGEQPILEPGKGPVEYTVVSGENLWTIAQKQYKSGYNWVDIAEANSITNPNVIAEGQKLTIPDVEAKIPSVKTTQNNETSIELISSSTYTVATGDSLWNIALRAYGDGFKWTLIAQTNNLKNPSLIHSGNNLTLPR